MTVFGALGFSAPWLLVGLIALPVLWFLLRAVPPAPTRRKFPAVSLLLGLQDDEHQSDKTPWWLLLLRMLAVAAVIIGLAGPVLNPDARQSGRGPILVVLDASWASATDWRARVARLEPMLAEAGRNGRPVAILPLTAPAPVTFADADAVIEGLPGLAPAPWEPRFDVTLPEGDFDTWWLSDGLDYDGREELVTAISERGNLTVFDTATTPTVLMPPVADGAELTLSAMRLTAGPVQEFTISALGPDPSGVERILGTGAITFEAGEAEASTTIELPSEIRARVSRFSLDGVRSAGAVTLTDDRLQRREVALIDGGRDREALDLLSPLHYLRQALEPTADLLDGGLEDILLANPDTIILADVARLAPQEEAELLEWIDGGGQLVRFAGPRLAASDVSRDSEDPLLPVRLRAGGRSVGGAMSWGDPKTLAPFPEDSPFAGLPLPDDVDVTSQVVAQPDPTLTDRVIASLSDGTPLVTRKAHGAGQIVLFHVTANAEWSTLPLSGLFVQMLERLSISSHTSRPEAAQLAGTTWQPMQVLDGFGRLTSGDALPGVAGEDLFDRPLGPDLRPGLYESEDRRLSRNLIEEDSVLTPAVWPASVSVQPLVAPDAQPLGGVFLTLAALLLAADLIASLIVGGRLRGGAIAAIAACALAFQPDVSRAQEDLLPVAEEEILAAGEVTFANVLTGNQSLDTLSLAAMRGLARTLFERTSVEPSDPRSVDLEEDELSFYPLLYWPITPDQTRPSDAAYARLNEYLRGGGMILFDTRDADTARLGANSPEGAKLRELAAPLDIPPLERIPQDHVLTRAFYLLQDFPGRYNSRDVWVEAAPEDAIQIEGMPFRDLNDGVTPVIVGGNDWASAWAIDDSGYAMRTVGRGYTGERQREMALRFGVNLVMHVLTGNYKSDQVHVPALLDRLGQ